MVGQSSHLVRSWTDGSSIVLSRDFLFRTRATCDKKINHL